MDYEEALKKSILRFGYDSLEMVPPTQISAMRKVAMLQIEAYQMGLDETRHYVDSFLARKSAESQQVNRKQIEKQNLALRGHLSDLPPA